MAAKWTRIVWDSLLDGIFVCSVAVILVIIAAGDRFPPTALGAENSKSNLVPYFVTWHVSVRGYVEGLETGKGWSESGTTRDIWDMAGSAITRFHSNGSPADTRYLTVTMRRNTDFWNEYRSDGYSCSRHASDTIADTGSYSGSKTSVNGNEIPKLFTGGVMPLTGATKRGAKIYQPFGSLTNMNFISHSVYENCKPPVQPPSDMLMGSPLGQIIPESPDLFADRDDASSFSVDTRYTAIGGPVGKTEVHWTAHAYLMGKCAERDGPIEEDDPIITHEEVNLDSEQATVNATPPVGGEDQGVAKLTIRVTCERVPIQNAELRVKVEAVDKSGGHDHSDDDRPRGKIDGVKVPKDGLTLKAKTDADGKIKFKYAAPLTGNVDPAGYGTYNIGIAGIYKLTAKSIRFPETSSEPAAIESKVDALVDGSGSAAYDLIGQTAAHKLNSYFSPGTLDAFGQLAADFSQTEQDHEQQLQQCQKPPAPPPAPWFAPPVKVSLNDIALPSGGIFDLDSDWQPSHFTHNKGEGGDFNRFDWITGTGKDCDATCTCTASVNKRAWLLHTLLEAGESYGKWDCKDLGNPPGCSQGEPPTSAGYITAHPQYPHRLHLHVEDATP